MTDRARNRQRSPQRSALYVVRPEAGITDAVAKIIAEQRELAACKRTVERALRSAGMRKAEAVRLVAGMTPAAILAEAQRLRERDRIA